MTGARVWKCRWNAVRIAVAAFALWALVADSGARIARLRLAALPGFDFAEDAAGLRAKGRFGEARASAEAGLAFENEPEKRAALERERSLAAADDESWLRRARDVGLGALTGVGGDGDEYATLERLAGSVVADFFVVGDVRDLVIYGLNTARGRDADPVIAALSAVGLATTAAPQIDWGASLLKAARRSGAMGRSLTDVVIRAVRAGDTKVVRAMADDAAALSRAASPSGAARLIRLADEPADLARMARFAEAHGSAGVGALRLTGRNGVEFLRGASRLPAGEAARAERLVLEAGRKGAAGGRWLKHGGAAALLKPHALVGLVKVFYKGDAPELARRLAAMVDGHAWWLIPALAGWIVAECWGAGRRLWPGPSVIGT